MLFTKLTEHIIHPVLSGVISFMILFGVITLASFAFKKLFANKPTNNELLCSFFIVISFVSLVAFISAQLGFVSILRWISYGLVAMGIIHLSRIALRNKSFSRTLFVKTKALPFISKIDVYIVCLFFIAFFFCVVSPPTDADSLDYHLGAPLSFLNNSGSFHKYDWIHFRLVGMGEYFNLLGLAAGTDNLNSCLQFLVLAWLINIIMGYCSHHQKNIKLFVTKAIIALPVLLFLVPSQKPQLTGTIAIVCAVSLIIFCEQRTRKHYLLATAAIFYAFSTKYSFYVTGFVPLIYIFFHAYRDKKLKKFLFFFTLFYMTFLFPIHLVNFINYDNPVSPLFCNMFRETGYEYLHEYANINFKAYNGGLEFPFCLLIPSSVGNISTILGMGIFSFLFVNYKDQKARMLVIIAVAMFCITALLCQRTSRFFIGPYFLALIAVATASRTRLFFPIFDKFLTLQAGGVCCIAVFGAVTLFPGVLSFNQRDKVMSLTASEFSVMKFLDEQLPKDSCLISSFRSHSLLPREFIGQDYRFMIRYYPKLFFDKLKLYFKSNKTIYYIHKSPLTENHDLKDFLKKDEPYCYKTGLVYGTRNPFNRKTISVYAYELDASKLLIYLQNIIRTQKVINSSINQDNQF